MLSVIVPVYNTAKYLPQCLDSILNQTYKDIEVIIVNDASPDNAKEVIARYAGKDRRIVVVDKEKNEGVDRARFSGIAVAKGERVTFIDSDDWFLGDDLFEKVMEKCRETDADYVEILSKRVMDKRGLITTGVDQSHLGAISMPSLFDDFYLSFFGVNILPINIWGKFYKRQLLEHVTPSGRAMGEDLLFNLVLFPHLKKIYRMDLVGYAYRFGGMTSKYNQHLYSDLFFLFELKLDLIKKYDYTKALDYTLIEIKNVLMSDIRQMVLYKAYPADEIKRVISERLEVKYWEMLRDVKNPANFAADPIVAAILRHDADALVAIAKHLNKKERPVRWAKRVVSWLCQL